MTHGFVEQTCQPALDASGNLWIGSSSRVYEIDAALGPDHTVDRLLGSQTCNDPGGETSSSLQVATDGSVTITLGTADVAGSRISISMMAAEELGVPLFIHPQSTPELAKRFKGNGWLSNVIGNPLDTTIALQRLIFDGVLDKFPKLKIVAAHGGGYFPSYAPRSNHGCFVSPQNCDPSIVLKKKPTEYLNQLYFDALVFTPEALRHLVAQVGSSQVMLGTDHPIPWEDNPVDHVLNTPSLSQADRAAILGENAKRMLGL